jgi:Flp pilus assembly protein TadG
MRTSRTRSQRGLAAVEAGLVLPLLLFAMFGLFEFGMAYYRQQVLTGAVREAARMGTVAADPRPTTSQIKQKVLTYLSDVGWDSSKATVSVTGAQGGSGQALTVQVTYPTSLVIVSALAPKKSITTDSSGNVSLTARVVMELE